MPNYKEPLLVSHLHARGRQLGLPIAGTFELTPRCNFHCKMCYVHLSREEQERRGKELTAEQWLQIAREAKDAGMVFLLLTGGEPLLRPDFPEIYRQLKAMGFIITINSNGYLIRDDLRKLFIENPPVRINISLYGTSDATYDKMCGVPAYERITENIRALREAGIDVKINMSLTPDNQEDMESVFRTAQSLGVHTQSSPYMFPPIRIHPESIGQNKRMPAEEAGEFMTRYNALCMDHDSFCRTAYTMEQGLQVELPDEDTCQGTPGSGITCRAGITSFWLTWDGKMMPCGQMVEPVADTLQLGFDEAWRQIRQAAAEIRLPGECVTCQYRNVCHVCAAMCYCETGRFDGKPEYICKMNQTFADTTVSYWKDKLHGELPQKKEDTK